MFGALDIFENICLTVPGPEDWSRVRSPGRARRRRRRGFRQNIVVPQLPDPQIYKIGHQLIMHPEMARKLRAAVRDTALAGERAFDLEMMKAIRGQI